MSDVPIPSADAVIVAKASNDYRWRRYALVLLIFGFGVYSYVDGFHRYPDQLAKEKREHPGLTSYSHTDLDIKLNQIFGIAFPPLALLLLVWALHASRGEYRFDGVTLSTPGHADVPVDAISKIDRSKWDRKGIAYLHYQLPGDGKSGIITLDDFIYQRMPTDTIFKRIQAMMEQPLEQPAESSAVPE